MLFDLQTYSQALLWFDAAHQGVLISQLHSRPRGYTELSTALDVIQFQVEVITTITVPYLAVAFAVESMDDIAAVVVVVCCVQSYISV